MITLESLWFLQHGKYHLLSGPLHILLLYLEDFPSRERHASIRHQLPPQRGLPRLSYEQAHPQSLSILVPCSPLIALPSILHSVGAQIGYCLPPSQDSGDPVC